MHRMSLTVAVPTLNSGRTLDMTLTSLKPLISSGAHVVVADSNSSDDTHDIANAHGVQIVYSPPGNMYNAVNLVLLEARSEWVTYINSDDIVFAPELISGLISYGVDADVICGPLTYLNAEGKAMYVRRPLPTRFMLTAALGGVMPFPQPGTCVRGQTFRDLGGFDVSFRLASDFDFFLRCLRARVSVKRCTRSPLAGFRMHAGQLSNLYGRELALEVYRALGGKPAPIRRSIVLMFYRLWNSDYIARQLTGRGNG